MAARILVVDDEPDILQFEEMVLGRAGYSVDTAADGPRALRQLTDTDYDLFILDVMMPEMNGFDVCRTLRANSRNADVPVLFLTAKREPKALLLGFEAGATMYLSKPFTADKLLVAVSTLIDRKPGDALEPTASAARGARRPRCS